MINKLKLTEYGQQLKDRNKEVAINICKAKEKYTASVITEGAADFFNLPPAYGYTHSPEIFDNIKFLARSAVGKKMFTCRYDNLYSIPTSKIIVDFEKIFEIDDIKTENYLNNSYHDTFKEELI
jgi:hypothetical protein